MNKLPFVILIIMMKSFVTLGQQTRFETGLEAGPNFLYMGIDENDKTWISIVGGLHFQCNFSNYVSISTNLYYEMKGEKRDSAVYSTILNNSNIETDQKYKYLTAPLLFRITSPGIIGKRI